MKIIAMSLAAILAAPAIASGQTSPQPQQQAEQAAALAESFIRRMAAGDAAGAQAMVGPRMQQAGVTAQMLEQTWAQLSATGALGELRRDATMQSGGYQVVDLIAAFGPTSHRLRVSVDAEGRIEGFRLFPVQQAMASPPPPYARAESFEELELTVGAEGWPLGATLTVPKDVARAPLLVLVHGSGAHDRDETVANNKPFRDLAHGLASRGIAVLRYEKRNWKHAARMMAEPRLTVDEEVIDDALAVLQQLRAHPRVDSARVYLLGHSLGGMLGPEIAARDGRLAGLVLLAGSPRKLTELVLDQVAYLATLPVNASPQAQQQLTELRTTMQQVQQRALAPEQTAMGAPASYYYDLAGRDALESLRRVRAPVLVLHGGRDYQVTEQDYEAWRTALATRRDASFQLYPDLNHLFMTGTGRATPAEYLTSKGHVDARVIADIAAFIERQAAVH